MSVSKPQPAATNPKRRWFYLTPDRLILALLAVEGFLLLSERFRWFSFNEYKGYAVLIASASVGVAMLLMLASFAARLAFRWRFQYSIRSLLVLVVVIAIPCSWLAVEMKKTRQQREAVEAIVKAGGQALFDCELEPFMLNRPVTHGVETRGPAWLGRVLGEHFFSAVRIVYLADTQVTDERLRQLQGLTYLEELQLRGPQVTNAGLKHLGGLIRLQWLDLSKTRVTDAGLEHLKGLYQLQSLDLSHTQITDAGLEHLKGLTQLQELELDSDEVTEAGLKHLRRLAQLTRLNLGGTQVTDAGLEHLKGLTQLESLDLGDTEVTDGGVKKLERALPNCNIYRYRQTRKRPVSRDQPGG